MNRRKRHLVVGAVIILAIAGYKASEYRDDALVHSKLKKTSAADFESIVADTSVFADDYQAALDTTERPAAMTILPLGPPVTP